MLMQPSAIIFISALFSSLFQHKYLFPFIFLFYMFVFVLFRHFAPFSQFEFCRSNESIKFFSWPPFNFYLEILSKHQKVTRIQFKCHHGGKLHIKCESLLWVHFYVRSFRWWFVCADFNRNFFGYHKPYHAKHNWPKTECNETCKSRSTLKKFVQISDAVENQMNCSISRAIYLLNQKLPNANALLFEMVIRRFAKQQKWKPRVCFEVNKNQAK